MNMVYYMNLSIIIATLDRPDNLDATLKSLLPEAELLKEIIIIDQSENRKSKQICDEYKHKWLPIFYYKFFIKSLTQARNFWIIKLSPNTDIVLFLDDDVTLAKDCLSKLESYIDTYQPKWWVLNIETPSRYINTLKKIWFFLLTGTFKFNEQFVSQWWFNAMFLTQPIKTKKIERCSGCAMFFRKSLFNEWFKFPEKFQKYSLMEDVFLSYDIYKRYPGTLHYIPNAKIIHHESPIRSIPPKAKIMQNIVHRFLFVKKFNLSYIWYVRTTILLGILDLITYKKISIIQWYLHWFFYVWNNRKELSLDWSKVDYNMFIFSK